MPGYVKTDEEVERIETMLEAMCFTGEELGINFETTWDFARWVLPPILSPVGDEAAGRASAVATVGHFQGAHCGPFDAAVVSIQAEYEGMQGEWMLTEIVTPELPVTIGRELWGEVKKNGIGRYFRDGTHFYGFGERRGLVLFEIDAEITGEDRGASEERGHGFDVKWFPHTNSRGLQYPPLLNVWNCEFNYSSYREGTGTLKWGHSKWDPTDTIPIVSTGTAFHAEYEGRWPLGQQIELDDPENIYRRYMWGQAYDDPTLFPIAKRYQGLFEVNEDPDAPGGGRD